MRRGATLIELLVVTGIIAALTGLTLAGVQRVRQAAARTVCQNNLRQLALAAHHRHAARGAFPPGTTSYRDQSFPYQNWHAHLLPYLEQDALAQQVRDGYKAHRSPFVPDGHPARAVVVPVFGCPTDDRTRTAWTLPILDPRYRIALTSYLGNAGTDYRTRDGVLFLDSNVRVTDIADGSSQTLLIGERPPSWDALFGWWHSGAGQAGTGVLDSTLGAREVNAVDRWTWYRGCGPGPFPFSPATRENRCAVFHYWSEHPGGANMALSDGGVRFLRYSVSLPALATRAGGETGAAVD